MFNKNVKPTHLIQCFLLQVFPINYLNYGGRHGVITSRKYFYTSHNIVKDLCSAPLRNISRPISPIKNSLSTAYLITGVSEV